MARALVALVVVWLLVASAGGAATPRTGGTVIAILDSETPFARPYVFLRAMPGAFTITPDESYRENLVSEATIVTRRPFTVVYRIRPEASWSDGKPVTARDFVFTFGTHKQVPPDHPFNVLVQAAGVPRVAAIDAKTVKVAFKAPFADWRHLFHFVLPEHAFAGEDVNKIGFGPVINPRTGEPIGSGPFLLSEWERGRQIVLVRNPRYWGRRPYLDRILVRFVTTQPGNAEKVERLASGEADLVTLGTLGSGLPGLPGRGFTVRHTLAPAYEHIDFNLGAKGHPALQKRAVRRAIAYGIDRVALVRALFGASAKPLDNLLNMANSRFYEPHWSIYRHNPDRARRLLESAGCRRGADGIYVCDERRLSFRFVTTAGNERRLRTFQLVQAQLKEVGIELRPEFGSTRVVLGPGGALENGDFDLILFTWLSDRPGNVESANIWQCQGFQNFMNWCNRQVTSRFNEARVTLDREKQARRLNDADYLISRAVPSIPLYQPSTAIAFKSALRGVRANVSEDGLLWNAEDWWLER